MAEWGSKQERIWDKLPIGARESEFFDGNSEQDPSEIQVKLDTKHSKVLGTEMNRSIHPDVVFSAAGGSRGTRVQAVLAAAVTGRGT